MTETNRLALLIQNSEIAWVQATPNAGSAALGTVRLISRRSIEGGLETPSVETSRKIVETALEILPEGAPQSIVIGLPGPWLEHITLSTPRLKGLDEISFLLREVTKRTSLPVDDVLFCHRSVETGISSKKEEISRLVVATREAPLMALVDRFAADGITVEFVGSSCASLLTKIPVTAPAEGSSTNEPEILFHAQRGGFSFTLRIGPRIVQYRAASIEMPEDLAELGTVIAEEVRRAIIYFREKHRGREIRSLRILGVRSTDSEALADTIQRALGLEVSIENSIDAEPIGFEDALGLVAESHDPRTTMNLIPIGERDRNGHKRRLAPVVFSSALGVAALVAFGWMMHKQTKEVVDQVSEVRSSVETYANVRAQHSSLSTRLDSVERAKEALTRVSKVQIPLPKVIAALSGSVPDKCQILRVNCSSPPNGESKVQIVGMFVDSYWELDGLLDSLMRDLNRRTGLEFKRTVEPDEAHSREFQTFALEARMGTTHESSDS